MSRTTRLSKLDQFYRRIWLKKFFGKGWGEPELLQKCVEFRPNFQSREACAGLIGRDYPVFIEEEKTVRGTRILRGHFRSPLAQHLPDIVKPPIDKACFEMVLPEKWQSSKWGPAKPLVIQLAGTGDHYFKRRRVLMANPLAKRHGIASILLENPFYGYRKPEEQWRSALCRVMDLFVMGGCLILECFVLLDWCERHGYGPLALHGVSMGGHMASLAAGIYPKPVALVPCLSSASSASSAFTKGVMSKAVPWSLLKQQYEAYRGSTALFDISHQKEPSNITYRVSEDPLSSRTMVSHPDNKAVSIMLPHALSIVSSKLQSFLNAYVSPLLHLRDREITLDSDNQAEQDAVVELMRNVLDEFTHLEHFPKPVDQELVIVVAANHDAYLPDGVTTLEEIWPGAEIRHVNRGHISAFLFDQSAFRKAIVDALQRSEAKYSKSRLDSKRTNQVE